MSVQTIKKTLNISLNSFDEKVTLKTMDVEYIARCYESEEDVVFDKHMYMPLYLVSAEQVAKSVVTTMEKNLCINKMPVVPENGYKLWSFSTKVVLHKKDLYNITEEIKKEMIAKNIPDNMHFKLYLKGFLDVLVDILGSFDDSISPESKIYVDMYDSTVSSNRVAVEGRSGFPLINCFQISEFNNVTDMKLSFKDTVTGYNTASFQVVPFTIEVGGENPFELYFTGTSENAFKINKDSLAVSYIGTICTENGIGNVEDFRVSLDFGFRAENGFYHDVESFKKFNEFVDYVRGGKYDGSAKFDYTVILDYISVTTGSESPNSDLCLRIMDAIKNLFNSEAIVTDNVEETVIKTTDTRTVVNQYTKAKRTYKMGLLL